MEDEYLKQINYTEESSTFSYKENTDYKECSSSDDENVHQSAKNDSTGPLHECSNFVSQLPIKKGLSKFYRGKSQSFSSFSEVKTVEDLAKKETPIVNKSMKPSRSYAGGLNENANSFSGSYSKKVMLQQPKKMNPKSSACTSAIARTSSGSSYFASSKPPCIPIHKKM